MPNYMQQIIEQYKPNNNTLIDKTKYLAILKAKNLNINKTTWPHLILVAKRIAKVKGRIKTPITSNTGIINFKIPVIPKGRKWLNILIILFTAHNTQPKITNKKA